MLDFVPRKSVQNIIDENSKTAQDFLTRIVQDVEMKMDDEVE